LIRLHLRCSLPALTQNSECEVDHSKKSQRFWAWNTRKCVHPVSSSLTWYFSALVGELPFTEVDKMKDKGLFYPPFAAGFG
jgi:hypothetical protein